MDFYKHIDLNNSFRLLGDRAMLCNYEQDVYDRNNIGIIEPSRVQHGIQYEQLNDGRELLHVSVNMIDSNNDSDRGKREKVARLLRYDNDVQKTKRLGVIDEGIMIRLNYRISSESKSDVSSRLRHEDVYISDHKYLKYRNSGSDQCNHDERTIAEYSTAMNILLDGVPYNVPYLDINIISIEVFSREVIPSYTEPRFDLGSRRLSYDTIGANGNFYEFINDNDSIKLNHTAIDNIHNRYNWIPLSKYDCEYSFRSKPGASLSIYCRLWHNNDVIFETTKPIADAMNIADQYHKCCSCGCSHDEPATMPEYDSRPVKPMGGIGDKPYHNDEIDNVHRVLKTIVNDINVHINSSNETMKNMSTVLLQLVDRVGALENDDDE